MYRMVTPLTVLQNGDLVPKSTLREPQISAYARQYNFFCSAFTNGGALYRVECLLLILLPLFDSSKDVCDNGSAGKPGTWLLQLLWLLLC